MKKLMSTDLSSNENQKEYQGRKKHKRDISFIEEQSPKYPPRYD